MLSGVVLAKKEKEVLHHAVQYRQGWDLRTSDGRVFVPKRGQAPKTVEGRLPRRENKKPYAKPWENIIGHSHSCF